MPDRTDVASPATAAPALDPEALVAAVEMRSRREETPCGDGRMVWRAWGEGPPLVLFHGGGGAWSHWIRNIDALAAGHTVWAADLPGFGDFADPPAQTHEAIVDVVADGLRRIEPRMPADVVGFSFGGVIAGHLAARHPELVHRLVIIGSGGLGTPHGAIHLRSVRDVAPEDRQEVQIANLLSVMLARRESVDDLALYLQRVNPRRARLNPAPLVVPDHLLTALPHVKAEIAAIWGERDGPHPDPALQEAMLRRYQPDLRFRVIPNAGHWAAFEEAAAFNAALLELLDGPAS